MLADAQRVSMLQTMGIDVYRLRSGDAPVESAAVVAGDASVAVICPRSSSASLARFRGQLPHVLGLAAGRVQWHETGDADIPQNAAAYVAIGTEAARALGVQLSTMQQNNSIIAATDEPAALQRDAAAKRVLWQILKPVARRVRAIAE